MLSTIVSVSHIYCRHNARFHWHSTKYPFKIQALTAKTFAKNAAFEAISIRGTDFVCQGATVTLALFSIIQSAWSKQRDSCSLAHEICSKFQIHTDIDFKNTTEKRFNERYLRLTELLDRDYVLHR